MVAGLPACVKIGRGRAMTGQAQSRRVGADRRFGVVAVKQETPDLHKLAQVFLWMALARAEEDQVATERRNKTVAALTNPNSDPAD